MQTIDRLYPSMGCVAMAGALALMGLGCGRTDAGQPGMVPAPSSAATNGQTTAAGGGGGGGGGGASSCYVVSHDVRIEEHSDLSAFSAESCIRIEGNLFIQQTDDVADLTALSGLQSVSGFIGIADNTALVSAELDQVTNVGRGVVLEGNTTLESISFGSLRRIEGFLHVFNDASLTSVSLPALESVDGDVIFAGVNALVTIDLSRLTLIFGRFIFEHSQALGCLCLPSLTYVGQDFIVHFDASLRALNAPNLAAVHGRIEWQRNPSLEVVDVGSLVQVDANMMVVHNGMLPQCTVDDIVAGLTIFGGTLDAEANASNCQVETLEDVECPNCGSFTCDDDDGEETCTELTRQQIENQLGCNINGGTVDFSIPAGACPVQLSLSSYSLPQGVKQPYDDQILFDNVTDTYGPGSYTVSVDLPQQCGYQSDLYIGDVLINLDANNGHGNRVFCYDSQEDPGCTIDRCMPDLAE